MASARPAKETIRRLWIDSFQKAMDDGAGNEPPVYLTLPGAGGREIEMLVEAELIALTEVGAIAQEDVHKVVALESDNDAALELLQAYPGLNIEPKELDQFLGGQTYMNWPGRDRKRVCRAAVTNLDLNKALECSIEGGQLSFPLVSLIEKLAYIHAQDTARNWRLCLTLNATVSWKDRAFGEVQRFLSENFAQDDEFRAASTSMLGEDLVGRIRQTSVKCSELTKRQSQEILMVLVPKRIAHQVHGDGWKVSTVENLRYGGSGKRAPMVTWILDFLWDSRSSSSPAEVYKESLGEVLDHAGSIEDDGAVSR